jgi:hypothetical protein
MRASAAESIPVKKFDLFSVYSLGKTLFPISQLEEKDSTIGELSWPLFWARDALLKQLVDESMFLEASRRAAQSFIAYVDKIIPRNFAEIMKMDKEPIFSYQVSALRRELSSLETVLSNDMPGLASYMVNQKGIYRTQDLIEKADRHLVETVRKEVAQRPLTELRDAGKCLAYEVPNACAFHLWRAVEAVTEAYYQRLTGRTFEAASVSRNWGAYIKALIAVGADKKITSFLDHIREEYRNPQTHPDAVVTLEEAQGLFAVAMSSITQMTVEIQKLPKPAVPNPFVVAAPSP